MGIDTRYFDDKRIALGSVFLVANAFVWYFLALNVLQETVERVTPLQAQLIYSIHFGLLAICLIVGATIIKKVARKKLLVLWTLLGVLAPLVLLVLDYAPVPIALIASVLFAVSLGVGMPNCMEYFTRSTKTGVRGRYGGIIVLISGLGLFLLRLLGEGIEITILILVVWRLLGLLVSTTIKPLDNSEQQSSKISYRFILRQKSFILYVIPWTMFSLINYLTIPIQLTSFDQTTVINLQILENAIAGIFAVAAGFLMDYVGRKQAAIAGFALLGLSYAVLGFYPHEIASWYLYTVFDGITWGTLTTLFVVSIWGEINPNSPADKYYAIGILPFFISKFLQYTVFDYIAINNSGTTAGTLFSFTAFFLFVAVLPLVYAPETLPEKLMKERDLKSYVESAKKKAEKEADKQKGKKETKKLETQEKPQDSSDDKSYDEAKKLAEKYY